MDSKLYYCQYWHPICNERYEITISDIIYSQEKKYFQIHCIIIQNDHVLRSKELEVSLFETKIKDYFFTKLNWEKGTINKDIIKIWYFNEDDSPVKSNNIPMRFCITALGIEKYKELENFKTDLLKIIIESFPNK